MIGYSAETGRQTFMLLTREQIIQLLNRAKANSLAAYSSGNGVQNMTTCGYGVHVDRSSGTLFVFQSSSADCNARSDYSFSSSTDTVLSGSIDSYQIDPTKLQLISNATTTLLQDVVFTSPNELTYINGGDTVTAAGIKLELVSDPNEKIEVDVNNAGQISWQ
ncbi:MAG: hypothetical protein M1361_00915 [Patescibacteria group bacterium]|nr:hypothetical protein [Patescibacteria group bacterium]